MSSETDELITLAAGGNAEARMLLLSRYRERLKRLVALRMDGRLRSRFDASDVVQEALVVADARLDSFVQDQAQATVQDEPLAFYGWLRGIVIDQFLKLRQKHLALKRSVELEVAEPAELPEESVELLVDRIAESIPTPGEQLVNDENRKFVRDAIRRLRDQDRELIELRYLEQLDNIEIATVLGISVAAVRTRHFRAVARLRELLKRKI